MDASDEKLIAEEDIWATTDTYLKNEPFDYANETCINWKE